MSATVAVAAAVPTTAASAAAVPETATVIVPVDTQRSDVASKKRARDNNKAPISGHTNDNVPRADAEEEDDDTPLRVKSGRAKETPTAPSAAATAKRRKISATTASSKATSEDARGRTVSSAVHRRLLRRVEELEREKAAMKTKTDELEAHVRSTASRALDRVQCFICTLTAPKYTLKPVVVCRTCKKMVCCDCALTMTQSRWYISGWQGASGHRDTVSNHDTVSKAPLSKLVVEHAIGFTPPCCRTQLTINASKFLLGQEFEYLLDSEYEDLYAAYARVRTTATTSAATSASSTFTPTDTVAAALSAGDSDTVVDRGLACRHSGCQKAFARNDTRAYLRHMFDCEYRPFQCRLTYSPIESSNSHNPQNVQRTCKQTFTWGAGTEAAPTAASASASASVPASASASASASSASASASASSASASASASSSTVATASKPTAVQRLQAAVRVHTFTCTNRSGLCGKCTYSASNVCPDDQYLYSAWLGGIPFCESVADHVRAHEEFRRFNKLMAWVETILRGLLRPIPEAPVSVEGNKELITVWNSATDVLKRYTRMVRGEEGVARLKIPDFAEAMAAKDTSAPRYRSFVCPPPPPPPPPLAPPVAQQSQPSPPPAPILPRPATVVIDDNTENDDDNTDDDDNVRDGAGGGGGGGGGGSGVRDARGRELEFRHEDDDGDRARPTSPSYSPTQPSSRSPSPSHAPTLPRPIAFAP